MNWKNNFFRAIALLLVLLLAVSLVVPVLAAEDADTIYIDNAGDLAELASLCALDTWSQGKTVVLGLTFPWRIPLLNRFPPSAAPSMAAATPSAL